MGAISYKLVGRKPRRLAVAVFALPALLAGCGYGQIHELDESAIRARSEIEVQLRRRAELVPNLLAALQAYGSVGDESVTAVADARASLVSAVRAGDLGDMEEWSARLSQALDELLAAVGRYSQLESDQGYQLLRSQLRDTEQAIIEAGRMYNEAAARFNEFIAEFPQLVTAKVIGAVPLETFEPWEWTYPPPADSSGSE
jgi:LemA protein